MTSLSTSNSHYEEMMRLLRQLHLLNREYQGESEEAEAVRDQMDGHWYALDAQEMAQIKILSADLRMIEGKEVYRPVPAEQRTQAWLGPKLALAYQQEEWWQILELLRNGPDFLALGQIAFLRGQCYKALGHPEIGLLFLEYAAQCSSQERDYSILTMFPPEPLFKQEAEVSLRPVASL